MKTIGLIGGLTWLSTLDYYRLLNEMANKKMGGVSSARIVLYSVEFAEIKKLTEDGNWNSLANIMCDAAKKLELAGADCFMIGANTMHKIADTVQAAVNIPLLNIAEETAKVVASQKINTVALLGTKYTMQMDFYKNKFAAKNIQTIIPGEADIEYINDAIYNEMGKGIFLPERKQQFIRIIHDLQMQGAEAAILGCTEIPILIQQEDVNIPVFDTTKIHVTAAIDFAFS